MKKKSPAQLKLFLFGAPRIELNGRPIEVDTRKAIALIAYLAVTGARQSREHLAALLWPEADQAHALAALRRTLSSLNTTLGGLGLEVQRNSVTFTPGEQAWCDAQEFQRKLSQDADDADDADELAEAVALHVGDFLSGFSLRDSPGFDDWQLLQTERYRRELASALERLVQYHVERSQYEPAITLAHRWLSLDPLHEPAHRQLMQLYAWSGDRAAALRQYRECARVLDEELGVPPLEETTQLYQAIMDNRLARLQPTSPQTLQVTYETSGDARTNLPLVGRSHEWVTLTRVYEGLSGYGHIAAIEGEAGIGKTRLAEDFIAHARASGATTILARCYEGESALAYSPFIEGVRAALNRPEVVARLRDVAPHWLAEAGRLLPEFAATFPRLPTVAPLEGLGAQSRFFEGVRQVLMAMCVGSASGLLFLDDLHWADAASLDLLAYLVRRLRGSNWMIMATWRPEDVPSSHRLRQLLHEAQRAGHGTLITLSRLSASDVMELVQSVRPGAAGSLTARLLEETEGVPFFIAEYLDTIKQGEPGAANGKWPMPNNVRDLLRARLASITNANLQLLQTAAVIGRSFDFDTAQRASGRSEEEAAMALDALLAHGLIHEVTRVEGADELTYDFIHEKLRALVYDETSLTRRRLLHQRVANALIAHGRTRHQLNALAGQIARHYQLADRGKQAAKYFILAGDYARSLFANAEALSHYQAALKLGHPDVAKLREAIGDLQTLQGEYTAALASYDSAIAAYGASLPDQARLAHKLANLRHRRGEWELAEAQFRMALERLSGTDALALEDKAQIYADWSRTAHQRGDDAWAAELAQQALNLAEQAGDKRALARAHNILGILARGRRDFVSAIDAFERSLAIAEALNDPSARIAALNNLALALSQNGDVERAITLTETALVLCRTYGDRHREAALHNNLADLFHESGRYEASIAQLKQAVVIFAEIGFEASDARAETRAEIWKLTEW